MLRRWSMPRVLKSLAWLSVPLWLEPLAWWLAYHHWAILSYTGLLLLSVQIMLVLAALFATAILLGGPLAALIPAQRRRVLLAMSQALVFLLSFVGGAVGNFDLLFVTIAVTEQQRP